MTKQWKGKITVDTRDSQPDRVLFTQPIAPYCVPNILFIVAIL
jgi:hypothetical protein